MLVVDSQAFLKLNGLSAIDLTADFRWYFHPGFWGIADQLAALNRVLGWNTNGVNLRVIGLMLDFEATYQRIGDILTAGSHRYVDGPLPELVDAEAFTRLSRVIKLAARL